MNRIQIRVMGMRTHVFKCEELICTSIVKDLAPCGAASQTAPSFTLFPLVLPLITLFYIP